VRFWDASAVVPLLVDQEATSRLRALIGSSIDMFVWWGTQIECMSALARLDRDGNLTLAALSTANSRLRQLVDNWDEVDPSETLRETALRFLRVHPLRAADALQLAAAYLAADRRPTSLEIVTLDDRLAVAARKEGFSVLDIMSVR
jgi:predicted nucleic acid-binding protein